MTWTERIKNAESRSDFVEVVRVLGEKLSEDFEGYVGKATNGFTKFLTKGVFNGSVSDAFWRSDMPARFGAKWAGHKLYGYTFWRSLLKRDNYITFLLPLLKECPAAVMMGMRRHRVFFDDTKWSAIGPRLRDAGLEKFIEDCEALRRANTQAEDRVIELTPLLRKISPETLVLHFAIWLEKIYFTERDDREFRTRIPEKLEVLERALLLRAKTALVDPVGAETIDELKKRIGATYSQLRNNPNGRLESEALFQAIDAQFAVTHHVEMFCSFDWELRSAPTGVFAIPANKEQEAAWFLHQAKFHAMDTFEIWCPTSREEHEYMVSCANGAANQESANTLWHIYTALRFLSKHCGADVTEASEVKMGFSVEEAITVLICNRACYEMTFGMPRVESKANGRTYLDSLGITASLRDWQAAIRGEITIASRPPFEPREFTCFINNAATFPLTEHIPSERVRRIYDFFAQDIHAGNIELSNKLLLRNKHCDLLLPRIFSGDVKSFLFNHLFGHQPLRDQIAKILESRIADIFGWRKFAVILSQKLRKDGEADVLAYRDGTLFVVEAKCTRIRAKASELGRVRDNLQEGAAQLHRLREILPEFWDELHQKLNAPANFDAIQVIPLLVSNSLEFDHLYFDGILKVSDFELEMIFRNAPLVNITLNGHHHLQFEVTEGMASAIKMQDRFRSLTGGDIGKFALYPPGPEPSVEELIACIEESRFWGKVFGRPVELTPLGIF